MSNLTRQIERTIIDAATDLIKSGALDAAITSVIVDTIRSAPDVCLTETGFILKMAVEMMAKSSPAISFDRAKQIAKQAYREYLRDNRGLRFGAEGWDWSGGAARLVADEYEISHWELAA